MSQPTIACGFVGLVGRSNVGKSTLLNALLDTKLAITARRKNTTRHRILGVDQRDAAQLIYVDMPGWEPNNKGVLNRELNKTAQVALTDLDVAVLVLRPGTWDAREAGLLARLQGSRTPLIFAINFIDRLRDKQYLLPHIQQLSERCPAAPVVPISARNGDNLEQLRHAIIRLLPMSPPIYSATDTPRLAEQFVVTELVREQLIRHLGQELPHTSTVTLETSDLDQPALIRAVIWVAKQSHKPMVIGRGGKRIGMIREKAQAAIDHALQQSIQLELWVKVREDWPNNAAAVKAFACDPLA